MTQPDIHFIDLPDGRRIATRFRPGEGPATLVFLPGYASDMEGAKALALDAFAAERGIAMLRLDYSGTGSSSGRFADGTLARWIEDAGAAIDRLTQGPLILAGSSMGGWIMLHLALQQRERVRGLLGIAAAPDFTDWGFTPEDKATLRRDGRLQRADPYGGEAQLTTLGFWQSGEQLRLLHEEIAFDGPVRLIHGDGDTDVPVGVALRLKARLRSADVQLNILKGGGHRLSEPHEIRAILRSADDLLELAR
ncbi:alpha/beta fold hydrolase [Sphingomonas sp. GCM10030256]|uniref:alpha/beta fold hydrolase n=1 Tax=Sphingomonas sp. GCM10030256 TaxID=3273427 RepID=UPI003615C74C